MKQPVHEAAAIDRDYMTCLLSFRSGRATEVTPFKSQQLGMQDASVLEAHAGSQRGVLKQHSSMYQT
jgi:hypothetical protein